MIFLHVFICCCFLMLTETAAETRGRNQNINPQPPLFAAAQMVIAADGAVSLVNSQQPYPNIFVDGDSFLRNELKFTTRDINRSRRLAERAWIRDFNVSASVLEPRGDVEVSTYQITSALNTNSYLATNPCYTPAKGYKTLEGGFRMTVTNPNGIVIIQDEIIREVTLNTSFFYSWFILKNIRRNRNDCPGIVRGRSRAARSLITQILGVHRDAPERRNQQRRRTASRPNGRNNRGRSRSHNNRQNRGDSGSGESSSEEEEEDDDDGLPPRNIVLQYKTLLPAILLNSSGFAEVSIFKSNYEVFEVGKGLVIDGIPKHLFVGSGLFDLLRCIYIQFQ